MSTDLQMLVRVRDACATGEVARIRERAHLSRSEVARLAQISTSAVSRYERNLRRPRAEEASRYWNVLQTLQRITL